VKRQFLLFRLRLSICFFFFFARTKTDAKPQAEQLRAERLNNAIAKMFVMNATRHVMCVKNEGYPALLERNKVYRVISDKQAESVGQLRVVDESGEGYLYPRSFFQPVSLLTWKATNVRPGRMRVGTTKLK
jgi:hypothetical protein